MHIIITLVLLFGLIALFGPVFNSLRQAEPSLLKVMGFVVCILSFMLIAIYIIRDGLHLK